MSKRKELIERSKRLADAAREQTTRDKRDATASIEMAPTVAIALGDRVVQEVNVGARSILLYGVVVDYDATRVTVQNASGLRTIVSRSEVRHEY